MFYKFNMYGILSKMYGISSPHKSDANTSSTFSGIALQFADTVFMAYPK